LTTRWEHVDVDAEAVVAVAMAAGVVGEGATTAPLRVAAG
jgi:hypothetical protein